MESLVFRKLAIGDIDLLGNWLKKSYVKKFWVEHEILLSDVRDNLTCSDWINYFIVEHGQPIGFVQYFETYISPVGSFNPSVSESVGIDFMIGEESFLNKGLGFLIVEELVEMIKAIGKYKYIVSEVCPKCIFSTKVLVKNGFKPFQNGIYALEL